MDYDDKLKAKCALLRQMLEVSKQQPALIAGEDMEGLSRCMAERDRLAAEIDKVNTAIGPRNTNASTETAQVERKIHELLLAIQKQDAENIRLAEEKLKEYTGKISQIKQTHKGIQSYTMNIGTQDGSFIDKKK